MSFSSPLSSLLRALRSLLSARAAQASLLLALAPAAVVSTANAQGLQVTFGAKAVQTISFNGVTLEDVGAFPSDAFHIWHMKATDLSGNVLTAGQYGWGETNNGESWDPSTNTETYSFIWGTIATQFAQVGNNLNITVTETNYGSSGIIFDGAEIYPFLFHFPQDPTGFNGYSQFVITSTDPGVSAADFGSGIVTAVIPNESVPLYTGWLSEGSATYFPMMTSTAPYELPSFYPSNDVPVQPGNTFSYTVSLRFTPEGTPAGVADAYASFAATYPSQFSWTDKRIIGTAYLASSPSGPINQPGGYPTNPRRYFNDPTVDITTPAGLQAFQDRVLAQSASDVTNAQNMNAQGVITWDIEGEEYPQPTSYVCSPDQIAAVAPEMESTVSDSSSPWYAWKLDDAYFKTITNAGLRVGVCLRPQVFTLYPDGTAAQVTLTSNAAIIANLENKARYANTRWGVTLFYVDSTVDTFGGTLDPAIFQQISTDLPQFLFLPEEHTTRYYAYTGVFYNFIDLTSLGTPAWVYNVYPHAFGANLVNDVDAGLLAQDTPQLIASVKGGDILMGHADYWQANDPTLVAIYAAAGVGAPPSPPSPTPPTITWPTPASIAYGTPLSSAQLDASANVPGTFAYSPAAGSILPAGTATLNTTFTPANTSEYSSASASVSLSVTPATPQLTWPAPAPIAYGTALSSAQLDASANVPGTFTYSPAAGAVLPTGATTLTVTFTPADSTDYTSASASVPITVTQPTQTPVVTWPGPVAITYGTPLSATQLNATANVPGAFTYSPAAGSVLGAGNQTLSAVFTPSDSSYSPITTLRMLYISPATPQITWPTPAPISFGTTLSAAQLDASANVPGTFKYSPSFGAELLVGSNTLTVIFSPSDTTDYTSASASVLLTVNPASGNPTVTWPSPSPITYGTALSGTQLDATANVPGTFSYSPSAGAVLGAGNQTLTAVFTPSNNSYSPITTTRTLYVTQATPQITWPTPAPIAYGTALSAAQLDATANIPGSFIYSPGPGTVLNAGPNPLSVTFTPSDTTDYSSQNASVVLTVTAPGSGSGPVSILSPSAGTTVSGTIFVLAQVNVNLDAAGSYLMVDGAEVGTFRVTGPPYTYTLDTTTLTNGPHTLQIWTHDINNDTNLSAPVVVTVNNGSQSL